MQLATIPDICDKILPISAQLAKAKKLQLQLSVHTAESDEIYHSVLSGVDSLGVVFFSTRVQSPELRFTPLFEDEYVLCVGPRSPYWEAESITIKEAMAEPYIAYREEFIKNNGGVSDVFQGMTPNIVLRTDDIESIKKLISHDNYVAFFHRHMNSDDIYRTTGAIRAIPISDYDTSMQIGYIESTKYKLSNADRAFLEILKAAVRHSLQDESFAASDQ